MMDFLRRLAPPRATDSTRAVPILRSPFASETPLRAFLGPTQPLALPDEAEAFLSSDTDAVPAARDLVADGRNSITATDAPQALPPVEGIAPAHRPSQASPPPRIVPFSGEHGQTGRQSRAPAEARRIDGAQFSAFMHRAGPASADPLARPAARSQPIADLPPDPTRTTSPLSQSTLTQRTSLSSDANQEVHITIGRIDVTASSSPTPPARRGPAPRKAMVSLADYLRGTNGERR